MSSAANDKRGKLEEEFRNRMHDAEASPSQNLWDRIDHELTVQENGEYKKRAAFYRQLAAACITLLLLAGGLGTYYFSGPFGVEQPLASVAPATNADPAAELSAPSENTGAASALAGTAGLSKQESNEMPAAVAAEATEEQQKIARASVAAASSTATHRREGAATASSLAGNPLTGEAEVSDAFSEEAVSGTTASGTLAVTDNKALEATGVEKPLNLSRSLRQTIAALSAEDRTENSPNALGQAFPAARTERKASEDFKALNEQVMALAKRQEEEQQAKLLAFNEEVNKKESKSEQSKGDSRWSVGMAYAPSYFDQNIGLPTQMMMGSANRASLMPGTTYASAINSLYMEEAREEYQESTDPGFSFGFEMKTGFKLGKKLKLLTGLGFLQNTTRSKSSYIIQQFWGNTFADGYESSGPSHIFVPSISSNFATDSLHVARTEAYEVNHRYRYLTVPVGLQYEGSIGKDWFWYGGAGVAANILMQTTIQSSASEVKDVDYDLNENSPFRRLQWSGNMSGGIGKRLAGNMSVTIGPEFRSYFNTLLAEPENTQAPQGRPYALGLNMAVNYDLSSGKKGR